MSLSKKDNYRNNKKRKRPSSFRVRLSAVLRIKVITALGCSFLVINAKKVSC